MGTGSEQVTLVWQLFVQIWVQVCGLSFLFSLLESFLIHEKNTSPRKLLRDWTLRPTLLQPGSCCQAEIG